MSAGSGASNLGYGGTVPLSNVNGNFVNVGNTNNPYHFGSNEINGLPGLAGAKSGVDAAAGYVPGICMKGGVKKLRRKIKNITKKYKMKRRNMTKLRSLKNVVKSRYARMLGLSRSKSGGKNKKGGKQTRKSRSRKQRGGYSQFQNNLPMTPTYSTGGQLAPSSSALASPPPYEVLVNCTNCVDNYNHYTGTGFASKGH